MKPESFNCPIKDCGKKLTCKKRFYQHFKYAHCDERPFQCSTCSYSGKRPCDLDAHIKRHRDPEFACHFDQCHRRFPLKVELKEHIKKVHLNQAKYPCPHVACNYSTNNSCHLARHISSQHEMRQLECVEKGCSFTTCDRNSLQDHRRRIHGQGTGKRFVCHLNNCEARFYKGSDLRLHFKTHGVKLALTCSYDGCSFSTCDNSRLDDHINRKHTHAKFYQCNEPGCNFSTYTKQNLAKHKKSRHSHK